VTRGISVRTAAGVAVVAIGLAGCASTGGAETSATPGDSVSVVASTTILGSVVGQIMECVGGQAQTLMPVGADPHDYSPSSADVAAMVNATLVITNRLELEEGLTSALATAKEDGASVFEVGPELEPQPLAGTTDSPDPHVWMDVSRMATAATMIGDELATVTGDTNYATCGQAVGAALTVTDGEVRAILETVPESSRILVTDHEAFGCFADAYGYSVAGVVIPGGSTLSQPSSSDMAALADTVRTAGVKAIFANTSNPTALVDALAQEVGEVAVVELYVGSLGESGSGADTYQTMMLTNAQRIADALIA